MEEECETDPLIELVFHLLIFIPQSILLSDKLWPHPRVRSSAVDHESGDAEGGVYPAVCVHDAAWYLLHHTVNGVSKELAHRHHHTAGEQDQDCHLAVQSEHKVVYPYLKLRKGTVSKQF